MTTPGPRYSIDGPGILRLAEDADMNIDWTSVGYAALLVLFTLGLALISQIPVGG